MCIRDRRSPRRCRGEGAARRLSRAEGAHPEDRGGGALPQLPFAPCAPRHPDPQHHPPARSGRRDLRAAHAAHRPATARLRAPRRRRTAALQVDSNATRSTSSFPCTGAGSVGAGGGNFSLVAVNLLVRIAAIVGLSLITVPLT